LGDHVNFPGDWLNVTEQHEYQRFLGVVHQDSAAGAILLSYLGPKWTRGNVVEDLWNILASMQAFGIISRFGI